MSEQFVITALMLVLSVGLTSMFWVPALRYKPSEPVINFYAKTFWVLLAGLVGLLSVQNLSLILGDGTGNIGGALLLGLSASFVLFVLFAWGRLTLIGLKFVATHTVE